MNTLYLPPNGTRTTVPNMNQALYTPEQIRQKVISVVSEVSAIDVSKLDMGLSIREDIAPTSLDRVTLFMALEDEFSRSIAEDELEDINTLQDLIGFVEKKANE